MNLLFSFITDCRYFRGEGTALHKSANSMTDCMMFQPGPSSPRPSTSKGFDNSPTIGKGLSIIAPEWEDLDPTPDLQAMFLQVGKSQFLASSIARRLKSKDISWLPVYLLQKNVIL